MRLYTFLNEAIIKPDLKGLGSVAKNILKETPGKKPQQVFKILNQLFADRFIEFKPATRQSSDDDFAGAGISYAEIETKEPGKITIYLNDLSIFQEDAEEIAEYGIEPLYRILGHEMLHRQQFARMKLPKKAIGFKSFKEYYADKQELMALAHDMMIFMVGLGYSKSEMKNMLYDSMNWGDFTAFKEFSAYFKRNDPEYKQLMKYLYQYIDSLKS